MTSREHQPSVNVWSTRYRPHDDLEKHIIVIDARCPVLAQSMSVISIGGAAYTGCVGAHCHIALF